MIEHYHGAIQGWFDFEDLYRDAVAQAADGAVLVEVGCWKGKSLSFLLVEAANSGKNLQIFGVDHFEGSVGEDLLGHAKPEDIAAICAGNCAKSGFGEMTILAEESTGAAARFPDGSIDFCFIDASHDVHSVCADIRAWLPKIKPGGILAGHDRSHAGVYCAVSQLLPGFEESGSCWVYQVPPPAEVTDVNENHPNQ